MRIRGQARGGWRLQINSGHLALLGYNTYVRDVAQRASDVRCAWDRVLEIIQEYEELLFANEGQTSEHPRWEELSDNPIRFHGGLGYRTWKNLNYAGEPIGTLTGKLRAQLTGIGGGAGDEPFLELRPTRLTMGSDYEDYEGVPGRPRSPLDRTAGNDLGGMHAEGRRDYYPMPARPPIRVTRRESFQIADAIMDWVLEGEVP